MSKRRLRLSELVALAGAACVIVSLTLPWYGGASRAAGAGAAGKLSAWASFGPAVVFLILGCIAAILLALTNLFERSSAAPVAAAVWSTVFGIAATISAIVRLLERPGGSSSLELAPWLALIGAVAILLGGWQSMRDERQDLYEPAEPERRRL